ncbi:MAG: hypothetical protein JNN20_07185 [Betaproteobacteria bacterium]|nr:hypothetical protein [Betaproteobacteria bacterium]
MKIAALILALTVPSIAMADMVDLKWTDGAFSHKATLAPKKFLEVCGKLKKDQGVAWRFSGSGATDFNIHYHVGKDVVYPENRKAVAKADGTLVPALDQDFCWMWSNRSDAAVEVDVQLRQAAGK